jgi:hypothetical protein
MSEPTELAGVADAETQAAYAWALDDGVDDLPTQRLTPRHITTLGVAASLITIVVAGVIAFVMLHHQSEPAPIPPVVVIETTTSTLPPPPPPPPPPVTVTAPPPLPVTVTSTAPRTTRPSPAPEGSIGHFCSPQGATKWTGLDGELVCVDGAWVPNEY